ncbi:fungal specific transcription factor domain-containing protein [Colletotrichum fioriniae PJ7]|uniref:Fungal specific transcription factor domain-containing protein n=1 Tax=Colletotrichum fioriniae PJ7 TaxID=1445577 RepID=A0A010RSH7_9PEZI|nr:fungal specific transcription factor domain-containing protein [Colletotrichum fioriniae PJ7]
MPTKRVRQSERRRCVKACGNCKRRKERCDGQQPCRRCVIRRVEADCTFIGPPTNFAAAEDSSSVRSPDRQQVHVPPAPPPHRGSPPGHGQDLFSSYGPTASFHEAVISPSHHHQHRRASSSISHLSQSTAVPKVSRLIADGKGRFMFIGDAANLSFLKVIRRLVRDRVGLCPFTDDPLRHIMVEATPEGRPKWIITNPADIPSKPSTEQARYLLRWYLRATNCILDVFNESEILKDLEHWLRGEPTSQDEEAMNCIFFLIFGIGAQRCPDDRDADAEKYFNYGRFLAVSYAMENPTNNTVRSYILITVYLLGASRRNSAFMHLGVATRAAYALGIHRRDVPALFSTQEQDTRDRLWKALRVLDLFLAASLGRPLATSETRDTSASENYSASLDLCAIFESILNDVYAKRMVSTETLERISEQHRRWAARFSDGLAADGMKPSKYVDADDGERYPNIGLYHMKEAYYWSIMLLSRPFLIDFVSRNIARTRTTSMWTEETPLSSPSDQLLVHACVDSAIRTIDLLSTLIPDKNVAKRHPFVINSVFVSALVLGLAVFGDLDSTFPLDHGLNDAQALLKKFSKHDPVASRELAIVEHLQSALDQSVSVTTGSTDGPQMLGSETGRGTNVIQALTPSTDILLPMSPRTLLFDSYGQDMPFFPTMDASMAHLGYTDEMMLADAGALMDPPC